MIRPSDPDTVYTPIAFVGCSLQFYAPYSDRLIGLVTKDEYEQSLKNINDAGKIWKRYLIVLVLLLPVVALGTVFLIIQGVMGDKINQAGKSVLLAFGIILLAIAMLSIKIHNPAASNNTSSVPQHNTQYHDVEYFSIGDRNDPSSIPKNNFREIQTCFRCKKPRTNPAVKFCTGCGRLFDD
ncbi:unnamed protein product [Adineta ricciae]|uniref:Uncharacterized protein n=1 Tax=Adineta ricciae TaxID=249248 RepID=A0A815SV53_ADIRI|nr:unnamed protein product [Adineta ricciae]CAF1492872.1 unnamed protein product [Adineta ricciae]